MRIPDENFYLDYNFVMKKESVEDITLHKVQDNKDAKNYLNYGGNNYLYTVILKCRDYYKGLEILIDSLNSYIQMVYYLDEDYYYGDDEVAIVLHQTFTHNRVVKLTRLMSEEYKDFSLLPVNDREVILINK